MKKDAPVSKEFTVFDPNQRKYFTEGELSDIESTSKAGAQIAKRKLAESESSRRKLRRGTGGLLAKAPSPEDTGLPSLGKGGLGLTTSILGSETKL
jgi:hypothetical protein